MGLAIGDRVAGKYRIERLLGEGGMGSVYLAENERLRKRVALKVLSDALPPGTDAAERFGREAIAASSVKHPGIVEIFDADVHEGTPWIAMELLEGETLGARLDRGPMPWSEVLDVVLEALGAIAAVHAAGIIHRDLKPDNLFLEQLSGGKRRVKVLDFGIAKITDHELGSQTRTGTAMGTPYYLAPEQATNAKDLDARADVYAVGAILFRATSGGLPYESQTFGELVRQMYTVGPRPLGQRAPGVPGAVAALIDRCLSIDPNLRPGSAAELAAELERARSGGVQRTVAMEAVGMPGLAATPAPGSGWGPAQAVTPPPSTGPAAWAAPPGSPWGPSGGATPATSAWGAPSGPSGMGPPGSGASFHAASSGGTVQLGGLSPQGAQWVEPPKQGLPLIAIVAAAGALVLLVAVVGVGALVVALNHEDEDEEIVPVPVPDLAPAPPPVAAGSSLRSLAFPGADAARLRADVPPTAPRRGPDDALVTIVMFSDYQCPFCARVEPTLTQLRTSYGADLRVVWRDNPLPFHTNAMPAAELAREAFAQGGNDRYWQMHDILFENTQALSRADLERYGPRIGLDAGRVRGALDGGTHRATIQADVQAAAQLGASGTPSFFINGRSLRGAQPYEQFDAIVREELALARALVASGVPRAQVYARMLADAAASPPPQPSPAPSPTPSAGRPDPGVVYRMPIDGSPSRGPVTALVTIVEVSEFQCPFCARVQGTLAELRQRYGDDLRIVFKHNPLPMHANAMPAAEAAMEVLVQRGEDAFFRYHDTLFENQRELTRPNLELWASQIAGIDMARFRRALDGHAHQARIRQDQDLASRLGARGTPAFFINGRFLSGAQPRQSFELVIDEEMTRARAELARGTPRAQVYDALTRNGRTSAQ